MSETAPRFVSAQQLLRDGRAIGVAALSCALPPECVVAIVLDLSASHQPWPKDQPQRLLELIRSQWGNQNLPLWVYRLSDPRPLDTAPGAAECALSTSTPIDAAAEQRFWQNLLQIGRGTQTPNLQPGQAWQTLVQPQVTEQRLPSTAIGSLLGPVFESACRRRDKTAPNAELILFVITDGRLQDLEPLDACGRFARVVGISKPEPVARPGDVAYGRSAQTGWQRVLGVAPRFLPDSEPALLTFLQERAAPFAGESTIQWKAEHAPERVWHVDLRRRRCEVITANRLPLTAWLGIGPPTSLIVWTPAAKTLDVSCRPIGVAAAERMLRLDVRDNSLPTDVAVAAADIIAESTAERLHAVRVYRLAQPVPDVMSLLAKCQQVPQGQENSAAWDLLADHIGRQPPGVTPRCGDAILLCWPAAHTVAPQDLCLLHLPDAAQIKLTFQRNNTSLGATLFSQNGRWRITIPNASPQLLGNARHGCGAWAGGYEKLPHDMIFDDAQLPGGLPHRIVLVWRIK